MAHEVTSAPRNTGVDGDTPRHRQTLRCAGCAKPAPAAKDALSAGWQFHGRHGCGAALIWCQRCQFCQLPEKHVDASSGRLRRA